MSIEKMTKVNVFAYQKARKDVLELLQSLNIIEILSYDNYNISYQEDTTNYIKEFDKKLELLLKAIAVLDPFIYEKPPFYSDLETIDSEDERRVLSCEDDILQRAKRINQMEIELKRHEMIIEQSHCEIINLSPWSQFNYPLSFKGTEKTSVLIGSLSGNFSESLLTNILKESVDIPFYLEVLYASKEQTYLFVIVEKKNNLILENNFQMLGFNTAGMENPKYSPAQRIKLLEDDIEYSTKEIKKLKQHIKNYNQSKQDLQILYDCILSRQEKYLSINKLVNTKKAFSLTGYMLSDQVDHLKRELERKCGAYLLETTLNENEEFPVKLRNYAFARPMEAIVESFSTPRVEDIDPTFIMSISYYIFFGMMFSDAGYGLLVCLFCGLLGFIKKNVKPELRQSMRMFFYCGLSTFVWGLLFGGFFGNAVSVISDGFFGKRIEIVPILFDPIKDPLRLLIISVSIGVIHILIAYILKFISLWRVGKKTDAVCDAGFWITTIIGISLLAIYLKTKNEYLKTYSIVMIMAGLGGMILMAGRKHNNILLRLLIGVVSLYDLTGFLSDALSYSRLMALGLATGVIASVANLMSSLFGFGFPGMILFWIVFVFFHMINFSINLLGAYVHTNRLQYVEFFGKFYEGGGRKFTPFSRKYKYTKLKETE